MGVTDFRPNLALNINSAQLIAAVNIVTIRCSCIKKEILMGQMGIPISCPACKKVWFVSATSQIKIQEVIADLTKEATPFNTFKP